MPIDQQIALCSKQYGKWKRLALASQDMPEVKECLEKAMFWMELQTAFVALWSVEQARGSDPAVKRNLIIAKSNLSRKLADYAEKSLNEIKWR
jgi:hypothetical protein